MWREEHPSCRAPPHELKPSPPFVSADLLADLFSSNRAPFALSGLEGCTVTLLDFSSSVNVVNCTDCKILIGSTHSAHPLCLSLTILMYSVPPPRPDCVSVFPGMQRMYRHGCLWRVYGLWLLQYLLWSAPWPTTQLSALMEAFDSLSLTFDF